jgi:uncharacterized Rmd1/YagE family protein
MTMENKNSQKSIIYALCQGGHYDFTNLLAMLAHAYDVDTHQNVLHFHGYHGDIFIFNYGVVIFWHVPEKQRAEFIDTLKEFIIEPVNEILDDMFTYDFNSKHSSFRNDHINIPDNTTLSLLAISHGIAQSTKLTQFETRVQNTINTTEYIPQNIATTGKSGLRHKELAKMRGFLYLTKNDVMLHYDLLDVPDFFWENPELQSFYTLIAEYLEIKPRIEVLNKKLETIQDLLAMVADEQKHAHSSLLEWIIIWLIGFDILIILAKEILHSRS